VATPGNGRLILLSAIAGTVLLPVATWCVMRLYDQFDPMCGAGGVVAHRKRGSVAVFSEFPRPT
jgi:hypothetical protein